MLPGARVAPQPVDAQVAGDGEHPGGDASPAPDRTVAALRQTVSSVSCAISSASSAGAPARISHALIRRHRARTAPQRPRGPASRGDRASIEAGGVLAVLVHARSSTHGHADGKGRSGREVLAMPPLDLIATAACMHQDTPARGHPDHRPVIQFAAPTVRRLQPARKGRAAPPERTPMHGVIPPDRAEDRRHRHAAFRACRRPGCSASATTSRSTSASGGVGGHSNTVTVRHDGSDIPVDTGFIVYNEPTYPNLTALFAHLGVPTAPSRHVVRRLARRWRVGICRRLRPGRPVRAEAQPRLRRGSGRCCATSLRFYREAPRDLPALAASDMTLGGLSRAARLRRRLPPGPSAADGGGDLVGPAGGDPGLSGRGLHPLLRQSRPADFATGRPGAPSPAAAAPMSSG